MSNLHLGMKALIDFEEVIGMEPKNYLGDDFARVTPIYRVTQYNVACCYSALDSVRGDGTVSVGACRLSLFSCVLRHEGVNRGGSRYMVHCL